MVSIFCCHGCQYFRGFAGDPNCCRQQSALQIWVAIKSRVTDKGLCDAVDVAIEGMNRACTSQNADMSLFAAQVDLAVVDLLEANFEKKSAKQRGCNLPSQVQNMSLDCDLFSEAELTELVKEHRGDQKR